MYQKRISQKREQTLVVVALQTLADNHSCPDDKPFPRGSDACDRCDWKDVLEKYEAGDLSVTRESEVFDHSIRVSVVCDKDRPVDVDDVFKKLTETEMKIASYFESAIDKDDGNEKVLEIITGVCDYEPGVVDDCTMHMICKEAGIGSGCNTAYGIAYAYSDNDATHTAFSPILPENLWVWVPGNRYHNLQHEFSHLLDFTYFRVDVRRGNDLNWWIEGMPQFIQWQILNDRTSWQRGNNDAHMLEIFSDRWNVSNYYDGMRIFAFLDIEAPWLLDEVARNVRNGIYANPDSHLAWHNLHGYIASRHQREYERFIEISNAIISTQESTTSDPNMVPAMTDDALLGHRTLCPASLTNNESCQ